MVAYSGQLVGGVIHLPAIVQSEESLGHGFPFFGIFEAGTIGVAYPRSIASSSSSAIPNQRQTGRTVRAAANISACFLGELDELSTWKLWIVAHLWGGPICCCGLEEKTPNATAG